MDLKDIKSVYFIGIGGSFKRFCRRCDLLQFGIYNKNETFEWFVIEKYE